MKITKQNDNNSAIWGLVACVGKLGQCATAHRLRTIGLGTKSVIKQKIETESTCLSSINSKDWIEDAVVIC
jgi:hypothetical protein